MEQVHLLADLAVVALLGFLHPRDIGVQLLLVAPGGAVDALELRVLGVTAPVGAGNLSQLESIADFAGGAKMRSAAQVVPVAMPVERDVFVRRNGRDQLGLVLLAHLLEVGDRLVARPHFAARRQRGFDDLVHPRFDLGQIVGREGRVAGEVVIEAVFDGRADGHLGAGVEVLHRHGQQVGGVVAD